MQYSSFFKAVQSIPQRLGIWFWVIIFALIFSFTSPYFFSIMNFINISKQTSIFGLMAMGMTLVIITGGIDLSVGSVVSLSSAVFGVAWSLTTSLPLALLSSLVTGVLFGALNGYLVGYIKIPPFIATFGSMGICSGFAFALTRDSIGGFPSRFEFIGNGVILNIPIPLYILILFAIVMSFLLKNTVFGLRIYATGGSPHATKLSGIDDRSIKMIIYIINGFIASVAAVIISAKIRSSYPGIGDGFELTVIASAVIGGTVMSGGYGSISGALGGAFFVCMIQNLFNLLGVFPFMQDVITGVFIVIAVISSNFQHKNAKKQSRICI